MSTINCPSCNATLPEGAQFCTSCGHRMEAAPPHAAPESSDHTPPAAAPPPPVAPPPAESPADPWAQAPTTQVPAAPGEWSAPPMQQGPPTQQGPPAPPSPPHAPTHPPSPQQWSGPPTAHQEAVWDQQPSPGAPFPAETTPKERGSAGPLGAVLGLVGGIVAVVAVFLDWFSFDPDGGSGSSYTLLELLTGGDDVPLESYDAIFLILAGVAAVVVAALVLKTRSKPLSALLILAGIAVVGVALRDWMSVSDLASDLPSTITINGSIGLYLAYVAGGLAALGGVLAMAMGKKG